MKNFIHILIFASLLFSSTILQAAGPISYMPAGKWEEKAGGARLHILNRNNIRFSFSGDLPDVPCTVMVDGTLRTEYFGSLECDGISYNRAIFYFNYTDGELELTFTQNRSFFQTYIFVREGTRKPTPEI